MHIGSRDLDAEEERLLKQSDIQLVSPNGMEASGIRGAVETALVELRRRVNRVYLHVDIDVLHVAGAKPNHLAVPGGLSVQLVEEFIGTAREMFEVCAFAITSFDPAYDSGNRVLCAGVRLLEAVTR